MRFCCGTGARNAVLHIVSNDPDESPCDIALSGTCPFLLGGAVYSDLEYPIGSGERGVLISVDRLGGHFTTTTAGMMGLWQIDDVPPGTYTVSATKSGCLFQHVVAGVPGAPPPIEITVDQYHQAQNQGIQFLATCTALVPDLNCEDLAGFAFPSVDVGECGTEHAWTITNEGTATLTGTIWFDGVDPEQFEFVEGGDGFSLAPGQSRAVKVRFCPLSVGSKTAVLHIGSNDPDENPCEKPLSGSGNGVPYINCEDFAGHDYASIVVSLCSAEHTWLVVNEGTATLTGTISLTGADPNQFEFTSGEGSFVLPPGSDPRTVAIRFCPNSIGVKSASLHIESNDPDESLCERTIIGQGIPPNEPEINCEDLAGYDFESKTVGFCTVEHTWTLINEGAAVLTGDILLAGVDKGEFEFTRGGGGFGLGPGAQRIVGVRFCPNTVGVKAATLEIYSNDYDEYLCVIPLSGTGEACAASRDLAAVWPSYCDGASKTVQINMVAPPGAFAIVLEDHPPAGWTASNISHGGYWDAANHKVKWPVFFDFTPFPTQVSYSAEPPAGTHGTQCFAGVISIDGMNHEVCGDNCVDGPSGAYIPADSPQPPCAGCGDCSCATCDDRRVAICEMSGYACAWRRGCNDDLAGMARSAYIWMRGECYCWNGDDEMWYDVTCPPSATGCCTGRRDGPGLRDGSALRELPDSVAPGTWFPVAIALQPPADVTVVALEDQPPAGWLVRAISNGGAWDEIHGKVKWGPYFAGSIPSQVSYELLAPVEATGQPCFIGAVSFDGINQPIDGDVCIPPPLQQGDLNCDGEVNINDVGPFALALTDPAGYGGQYPDCSLANADLNGDQAVDGRDIQAFVNALLTP